MKEIIEKAKKELSLLPLRAKTMERPINKRINELIKKNIANKIKSVPFTRRNREKSNIANVIFKNWKIENHRKNVWSILGAPIVFLMTVCIPR